MQIPPIRKIDLETHSYCNRRCLWCSNAQHPRDFKERMHPAIFNKIIAELKSWKYDKYIFLFRYNEPLADREYLDECIKFIRKKLPKVKIGVNTNGDYFWEDVDCDLLTITDYDNRLKEHCDELRGIRIMKLKNLCDRGGSIKGMAKEPRYEPCYEPERTICIDYLGNVTLCCNFRQEIPNHRPFIFGNIGHLSSTLSDIYYSEKAEAFRKAVRDCEFPEPCKYCMMKPGRFARKNPSLCNDMETYE